MTLELFRKLLLHGKTVYLQWSSCFISRHTAIKKKKNRTFLPILSNQTDFHSIADRSLTVSHPVSKGNASH